MNLSDTIQTVGFKDMHQDQVEALTLMVHAFLSLADGYESEDIFEQAKEIADDVVILFGGSGIEVKYEPVL